ncbi:MAG: SufE family protein [Ketobacteraceae bacterium]|nr:SufE family protein [Ketobacteraceae bacterium]
MTDSSNDSSNPLGTSITHEDLIEDLAFFDSWEDRYRYIIDLGKKLPPMPEELKTEENFVHGCQSQVWIHASYDENSDCIDFLVESDAHIVRGLAAMVMAAYNHQTPRDILDFDIENYFEKTQLIQHLSPTRGNGLKSMVNKIRQLAEVHA